MPLLFMNATAAPPLVVRAEASCASATTSPSADSPARFARRVIGPVIEPAIRLAIGADRAAYFVISAVWAGSFGTSRVTISFTADAPATTPDTIFDLASLTKVIATTTLAMRASDAGRIALSDPVARRLPGWRGTDRADVTIRHLLTHSAGLTAYLPFYRGLTGRPEFEHAICRLPLEYPPDSQSIYSDLGFILLAFILEDAASAANPSPVAPGAFDPSSSFAEQFHRLASFISPDPLAFNPPRAWRKRCAPTEVDHWRGRLLTGEVHDENCWALGGAAGHAGLFGTAADVGAIARVYRDGAVVGNELAHLARTEHAKGDNVRRGLGLALRAPHDAMVGRYMTADTYGHTGFTGTSLWCDPASDLTVILLTNRVYFGRTNDDEMYRFRIAVHEAVSRPFAQATA